MEKKGQAAMEFLMTYGWAILAAIIAIGVLAYFGVFSPGKYISKACIINNPFGCDESALAAGAITLNIRNGGGEDYNVSSIAIAGCTSYTTATTIVDGSTSGAVVITCAGLVSGDKVNKDITITYMKNNGGTIAQTATGSISGRVP